MSTEANDYLKKLCKEQVSALYQGCWPSITISTLTTLAIFFTNYLGADKSVWLLPVIVVSILRAIDALLYSRADKKSLNYHQFFNRFAIGTLVVGCCWGLLFWNTFPGSSLESRFLIILFALGVSLFATTTLYYHFGIISAFVFSIMAPIEVMLLMDGGQVYQIVSVLLPTFFLFQFIAVKRINEQFNDDVRLQVSYRQKEIDLTNQQFALDQHAVVSKANVQGEITYANEKFSELSQYSKEELLGENHRVVKSGEHPASLFKTMWEMISRGQVWRGEIKNRAKDGTFYWVNSTIVPFMNEVGKPVEYISIRTDITKSKLLEQQATSDKNDALIRAQVSQILQSQGSIKRRTAEALDAMSKADGFQIQNKLGVFLLPEGGCQLEMFVVHGRYTDEFLRREKCVKLGSCLCGRAAVSGELIVSDDCMTDPDHEHHFEGMQPHGHYIIPLLHNKKVLGVLFIYTDPYPPVNQTRLDTLKFMGDLLALAIANEQVKEELQQAKKNAELVAEEKSSFLANMSHELRTPMNGVLGMLELMGKLELDGKAREYMEVASSSASMLLNLINDVLDISKMESGKFQIEKVEFDLRKTIEDSAALLSRLAHQKGLELSAFISPEINAIFKGDVYRIQQVLSNLISNAIKFTSKGEVGIHAKLLKKGDSVKLRVEVKDTGIGISSEAKDRLFKPFTQVDSSTSRKFGGTGLGLAISKRLIEMMGGEIGLISEVGEGSLFWFELPLDIVSENGDYSTLNTLRVLTIDDSETSGQLLKSYIESWGAVNVFETSPEKGIFRLKEAHEKSQPFDILLLDREMPGMSGDELAEEIRKNPAFTKLKIVLLSTTKESQNKPKYADLILDKPVRQSFLFDAIVTVQNQDLIDKKVVKPQIKNDQKKLAGKVLFVDDNIVNQHVGREMLSRLGLDFEVVSNGQEALEMRKSGGFDAVLMDCQMPVMDGFEATQQIRLFERETGIDRIAVIALTANAMLGDREKCLEAGMDDYLAKPYTLKGLFDVLSLWLPVTPSSPEKLGQLTPAVAMVVPEIEGDQADVIDTIKFNETREMMGESINLIIDAFRESGATNINEMENHLESGDYEGLRGAVHALKGSSAAVGAQRLYEVCNGVEEKCRQREVIDMVEQVEVIRTLLNESLTAIDSLLGKEEIYSE